MGKYLLIQPLDLIDHGFPTWVGMVFYANNQGASEDNSSAIINGVWL